MPAREHGPLVVVHGGGRAIDAELRARGHEPRFVDGLRVTDADALDAVVCVLAGRTNTALVAAVGAPAARRSGSRARTRASACPVARRHVHGGSGEQVDLGLVGQPEQGPSGCSIDLLEGGYVPVIASIGVDRRRRAAERQCRYPRRHLAAALDASAPDHRGRNAPVFSTRRAADCPAHAGRHRRDDRHPATAHSGMVAKLAACRRRSSRRRANVSIVAGRGVEELRTRSDADTRTSRAERSGRNSKRDDDDDNYRRDCARSSDHVLQVYRREPGGVRARQRLRVCSTRDGRSYLDLISGIGVAVARARASAAGRGHRRAGARAAAHVEPVLPPAAGGTCGAAVRRCRGCRARSSATAAPKRSKRA